MAGFQSNTDIRRSTFDNKIINGLHDKIEHFGSQPWIHADPEGAFGDNVGVREVTDHPYVMADVGGLTTQVATEEESGPDASTLKMLHKFAACEW